MNSEAMIENHLKIGIIGQGFVGNALFQKFKNYYTTYSYDKNEKLSNSNLDFIYKNCSIIFICLPTPMNDDGSCNISIVELEIEKINKNSNAIVVIKST